MQAIAAATPNHKHLQDQKPAATQLISRKKAAEMVSVHITTIDRWINQGKLKRYKFGSRSGCTRVSEQELKALFDFN
jgi:excisionase family DNA binding protein